MTLSKVPDDSTSVMSLIASIVAAVTCGFVSVKLIGCGGLFNGALSGLMLFAVRVIISLIFSGPFIFLDFLIAFAVDVAVSSLGGVAAVNTGK